jgi:uncharacterized NAD-dependent epimerase/dehydratase family protein
MSKRRTMAILADGMLDFHHGKTATSILRYRPSDVVAIVDSHHAGAVSQDVLGIGGQVPIVGDMSDALKYRPDELLIGIATRGGFLPPEWRRQIALALQSGVDVVNGLHYMMAEDTEFKALARRHGAQIVDVRRVPENLSTSEMLQHRAGSHVITFVGSDCAVGKMTAALEMRQAADARGLSTAFVATGQTGIMLEGSGIAIDRAIGDFMAGAVENLVVEACELADWVFVEGQGSLLHPAYSGVTLALMHGSLPDAMVLVHPPGHRQIDDYPVAIPSLPRVIQIYEEAAGWIKPARVVAIALNTRGLSNQEAARAVRQTEAETDLPAADPVKGGADKLVDAVLAALTPAESSVSGA